MRRTRRPLLPPGRRSRAAHVLTQAAAEGRFALPACADCRAVHYPARDVCPACLSTNLDLQDVSPFGRLAAVTTIHASTDPYFRERLPWRSGIVILDAGPSLVAHLHGDCQEGQHVRLAWKLDKSGQAVAMALPEKDSPNMADDRQFRELTLDPKFRRVLITDGRSAVGQVTARAFADAGAAILYIGLSDPWKPFAGREALEKLAGVEFVALDVTDTDSVVEAAASIGAKVDILVNTVDHVRPGGLIDRDGVTLAREEMELGYLGLMRLAQAFGPVMRSRGERSSGRVSPGT